MDIHSEGLSIESAPFDETRKKLRKLPDANQPLASPTARDLASGCAQARWMRLERISCSDVPSSDAGPTPSKGASTESNALATD